MSPHREVYYSAFRPTFLVCAGTGLLVGAWFILAWALLIEETALSWPRVLRGLGTGFVLGVVLSAAAVAFFPVSVYPSGVRSYTFWGVYRTLSWGDIVSAGRFNMLGLRYLVLRSVQATIYVPLFLTEIRRFQESVEEKAGPQHALTRALAQALGPLPPRDDAW